jgi:hypothetical protein
MHDNIWIALLYWSNFIYVWILYKTINIKDNTAKNSNILVFVVNFYYMDAYISCLWTTIAWHATFHISVLRLYRFAIITCGQDYIFVIAELPHYQFMHDNIWIALLYWSNFIYVWILYKTINIKDNTRFICIYI